MTSTLANVLRSATTSSAVMISKPGCENGNFSTSGGCSTLVCSTFCTSRWRSA
ncbi:hypothetical protein PF001_g24291 [Phytophthora fragariae]|uniref:Uncharacterized protein n=1 Tax=Phytophthora fragariae TaxID=53985 RepID=A0A6A4BXF8_9STRA|nr:hypothetical protein PF001_g24291 [Phytophthora fragariae]